MGLVKEESDEGEEDPIQERGQEGGRDGGPDPERATDQSDVVVIEGSQSRERVREMRKVGTRRREGRPTDSTPLNFTKDNDREDGVSNFTKDPCLDWASTVIGIRGV